MARCPLRCCGVPVLLLIPRKGYAPHAIALFLPPCLPSFQQQRSVAAVMSSGAFPVSSPLSLYFLTNIVWLPGGWNISGLPSQWMKVSRPASRWVNLFPYAFSTDDFIFRLASRWMKYVYIASRWMNFVSSGFSIDDTCFPVCPPNGWFFGPSPRDEFCSIRIMRTTMG
jgi:hypothetical protein